MKLKVVNKKRARRKNRVRAKIFGCKEKPRLSVFRSNRYIYAQLIDDEDGRTLAFAYDMKSESSDGSKIERASKVGAEIAKKALDIGIKEAVFDRGFYRYHGRVKALAEGARSAGLKF